MRFIVFSFSSKLTMICPVADEASTNQVLKSKQSSLGLLAEAMNSSKKTFSQGIYLFIVVKSRDSNVSFA